MQILGFINVDNPFPPSHKMKLWIFEAKNVVLAHYSIYFFSLSLFILARILNSEKGYNFQACLKVRINFEAK